MQYASAEYWFENAPRDKEYISWWCLLLWAYYTWEAQELRGGVL